jgi:hypothetical protein
MDQNESGGTICVICPIENATLLSRTVRRDAEKVNFAVLLRWALDNPALRRQRSPQEPTAGTFGYTPAHFLNFVFCR